MAGRPPASPGRGSPEALRGPLLGGLEPAALAGLAPGGPRRLRAGCSARGLCVGLASGGLLLLAAAAAARGLLPRGAGSAPVALAEQEQAPPICLKWTGGTCAWLPCDSFRNATCERVAYDSVIYHNHCMCPAGSCAGTDGACHGGGAGSERVASNFTLRNVRYADSYLSVTGVMCPSATEVYPVQLAIGDTIAVTPEQSVYPKRWDLYRVPNGYGPRNYSYMFTLVDLPEVAAGMFGSMAGRGQAIAPNFVEYDRDPRALMLSLCRPRLRPEALEISNTWEGYPRVKWCAKTMCVYGGTYACSGADPGSDRWVPEPPIELPLPDCVD